MKHEQVETCGIYDIYTTQLFDDLPHPTFYQLKLNDEITKGADPDIIEAINTQVETLTFGSLSDVREFATESTRAGFPNMV